MKKCDIAQIQVKWANAEALSYFNEFCKNRKIQTVLSERFGFI
jgi:hypothetical protein